jgi:hypothetical protein
VLHIDAPVSVNQVKCSEPSHTFNIRYNVINNTSELANGTVRAVFNGVSLTSVGSAKLQLLPGKQASGTFTACCPSSGSFKAGMEFHRDQSSTAQNKTGESVFDSINISCR